MPTISPRREPWRKHGASGDVLHHGRHAWPTASRSGRPKLRYLVRALPIEPLCAGAGPVQSGLRPDAAARAAAAVKLLTKTFKSHPIAGARRAFARSCAQRAGAARRAARDADLGRGARDARARHDDRLAYDDASQPAQCRRSTRARASWSSRRRGSSRSSARRSRCSRIPTAARSATDARDRSGSCARRGFAAATTSRNAFAGRQSDLYALERVQVAERLEDLVFALEVERFAFRPAPRPAQR